MKKQHFFVLYLLFVSSMVFSQDTTPPVMVCKNITIALDNSGNASITAAQVDGGSTDDIGIVSLTVDPADFECTSLGNNTVTLTGIDAAGNSADCLAIVTIVDSILPTVICNTITLELSDMGIVIINASDVALNATDNCDITYSASSESFDCTNVGDNTITLTVTDTGGNESTCIATVHVEDNFPPVAICSNFTVRLDETGNATVDASDIDGGSTDACEISSLDITQNSFDCSNLGYNEVTLTVTDTNGNSSDCIATIIVEDGTDPIAVCQDITLSLDESGVVFLSGIDIDAGSSDDCSGINSYELDTSEFDCGFIGSNIVTLTVTDFNGNSSTCTANVTIEDNSTPTVSCNDITLPLDDSGSASIIPEDLLSISEGGCSEIDFFETDISGFNCEHIGSNLIELTVHYTNGVSSSCHANVTIEDTTAPTIVCRDITVALDEMGNVSIHAEDIDNGSYDTCGIASMSVSPDSFSCLDIGENNVMLMVTDNAGNATTCDAIVMVENNSTPIAFCQDITVQLDAMGNAGINANDVDQGSTDPCGIASKNVTPTSFTCYDIGTNTVTLTVTNYLGISDSCEASVTIEDGTDPIAICQDITIQLDEMGYASISSHDIDGGSTDDCSGIDYLELDTYDFDCHNIGENTVQLTVYDATGNPSYCNAMVTVLDTFSPVALCQDITVQLDETGNITIYPEEIDYGSEDACEIVSITATPDSFSCADIGENTVTLTITDSTGNSSNCNATITVEDSLEPTVVCNNITVTLDDTGNVEVIASDIGNNSMDNCDLSFTVFPNTFDCSHIGANMTTLTIIDSEGTKSTCTATITVEDIELPTATCSNITVQLEPSNTVTITADDINNNSKDACGILALEISPNNFTNADIGENNVTLLVTDTNGNQSTCNAIVTIEEATVPLITCKDIIIQLDETGNALISPNDINEENDATGTLSIDITEFDCSNLGINKVTMTITDSTGKSASCIANVIVEDISPPVFDKITFPKDTEVTLDHISKYTLEDFTTNLLTTDNCSASLSITQTPSPGTLFEGGNQQVLLTVTDVSGNTTTKTLTIHINKTLERYILYPNPASDIVTIGATIKKVRLFNMKGRMVFESSSASFNISTLQAGVYFVQLEPQKNDILLQLIKK